METCFSVAVIVNQDLSLFPFHHEALYPYGLNHSSHWQWHRSNIIATHKTLGRSLSFPPITSSRECQLKSNFYKEIKAPLGSSAIYPHDRMPSRGGRGLLSFRLALGLWEKQASFHVTANPCLQIQIQAGSCFCVTSGSFFNPFPVFAHQAFNWTLPAPLFFPRCSRLSLSFWSVFCIPSCCFLLGRLCQAGRPSCLPELLWLCGHKPGRAKGNGLLFPLWRMGWWQYLDLVVTVSSPVFTEISWKEYGKGDTLAPGCYGSEPITSHSVPWDCWFVCLGVRTFRLGLVNT